MARAQLLEKEFEKNLAEGLHARGWTYEDEGSTDAAGWDTALALVPRDLLLWLETQYPSEYAKAVPPELVNGPRKAAETRLLEHVTRELAKPTVVNPNTGKPVGGLLGVLRSGFTYAQMGRGTAKFGPMMVFPPESPVLTKVQAQSDAVCLRVLRQVPFNVKSGETIDVVLTANGIPVVTMELKTDNTQSVRDAIAQYRRDRKPAPSKPLLVPGRALVHFAVSNDEVYMTTKLAGQDTVFLPFNRGNNGHRGNAPSPTGSKTDYLWREVLARPTFMRIVKDYALFEPGRKGEKSGRLVFPRFHQMRATEKVVEDIRNQGTGRSYLIWHSAGSGKTKTIAWLAHRLARQVDRDGKPTFDSVIVVTDRNLLDDNVRRGVELVGASRDLVFAVGEKSGAKSPQLRQALEDGGHIITCTLQTFPAVQEIIDNTDDLHGRRWAVIADEAHSSQTGSSAKVLRELLADSPEETGEIGVDELLEAKDRAIADADNITFIALTATPKAKTLRLFGTQDDNGRWEAFDTYTMAQAIEEGFILDVLTNYSTYNMFLEVAGKSVDQEVDGGRTINEIMHFLRIHPTSIAQKVQIVVEHFRRNVMPLLDGKAKAMVVTTSRQEAYHWSERMNRYIADQGYTGMKTLVAFSGHLTGPDGQVITEAGLNPKGDLATLFRDNDEYKVLIAADKFQTGFDEPLLMAMYVDKKLSGVAAVQTLSRLNRTYPGKEAPMVLDFSNDPEEIQESFKVYYSDAYIDKDIDVQTLIDLGERMDTCDYYSYDELQAVSDAYVQEASGEEIRRLISPIIDRWNQARDTARARGDKERLDKVLEFRADVIAYNNAWLYISQIHDFGDATIHRRGILASLLKRNLHPETSEVDSSYLDDIEVVDMQFSPTTIEADYGLAEPDTVEMNVPGFSGGGGAPEPEPLPLQGVIDYINKVFERRGVDIPTSGIAGFFTTVWQKLEANDDVVNMARNNTLSQLKASADYQMAIRIAIVESVEDAAKARDQAAKEHDQAANLRDQVMDTETLKEITDRTAESMSARHSRKPRDD